MAGLAPQASAVTKDTTDDDQCSWGCGRFSGACGEPDRDSGVKGGEEAEWDRFVMSSASGTIFHLSGWQKVVGEILGHRCFNLVACRENRITGVFPISWVRNRVFGDCMVSLPLAVYGGICADRKSVV